MRRIRLIATMIVAAFSTTGCVDIPAALRQPAEAKAQPHADGEEMALSYLPQVGFVRATRPVLATLGTPLQSAPGPNRTVEVLP